MTLGVYLRQLRSSRGLMQKQLAVSVGVAPSYLSNIEKGIRVYVGDKMLDRFGQALMLTREEEQQLRYLRDLASGKLTIPTSATEEELMLFRLLISHSGQMPNGHIKAVRQYLESWLQLAGRESLFKSEGRHMS